LIWRTLAGFATKLHELFGLAWVKADIYALKQDTEGLLEQIVGKAE
jgi:hypothetical protein